MFNTSVWLKHNSLIVAGEAGGFFVADMDNGLTAYLKPTNKNTQDHPRSALEKISYDIGYDLDLPVSPIQLHRRIDAGEIEEDKVCLSLVQHPRCSEWGKIKTLALDDPILRGMLNAALSENSGMVALDLFLGQSDRDNPRNVLWFCDDDNINFGLIFIDFSNSMIGSGNWNDANWRNVIDSCPKEMIQSIDKRILSEATEKVRNLDESSIEEIVDRVDQDYLIDANKTKLKTALLERRRIVADYINTKYL